jgi:hypothetical protein
MEIHTQKIRPAGPPWIRSASFSALLSETPSSRNSCYNACSAWASSKWAGGALAPPSGLATATSEVGRPARDYEASAPCVGRRGITQSSSHITSTPAAGSGAGAGQFSHWPHPGGGASSLGISTTAARSLAVGTDAGGTADAAVAAAVAATAATASCRDPVATTVPRDGNGEFPVGE